MSSLDRVHEVEDVTAIAETEKALLCVFPDGEKRWVPRSQVHELSDVHVKGDVGMLTVSRWWAEKAELVEEER